MDRAFDPLTYLLGMGDLIFIGGSSGFVMREANAKALEALRDSSVDYYAAMRSAFTQNRESRIAELRAGLCGAQEAAGDRGRRVIDQRSWSAGAAAKAWMRWSRATITAFQPSRLISDAYSDRRSASSLTVPFRYTSMILQEPFSGRSR